MVERVNSLPHIAHGLSRFLHHGSRLLGALCLGYKPCRSFMLRTGAHSRLAMFLGRKNDLNKNAGKCAHPLIEIEGWHWARNNYGGGYS